MTVRAQRTRDRANGIVCDQTPFARVIRVALRRYGAGEGEEGTRRRARVTKLTMRRYAGHSHLGQRMERLKRSFQIVHLSAVGVAAAAACAGAEDVPVEFP